jgi:predicted GNAT family N-acyltransferase
VETFIAQIIYKSPEYIQEIELRNQVLRYPLKMSLTEEDILNDEKDFHLGLFKEKTLIACLVLKPLSETEMKMRQVAVDPNFQGQGLGKQLVTHSENFSVGKGFKKIVLNARTGAVPFYQSLGYKITSDLFDEVNIPHYKMSKDL